MAGKKWGCGELQRVWEKKTVDILFAFSDNNDDDVSMKLEGI